MAQRFAPGLHAPVSRPWVQLGARDRRTDTRGSLRNDYSLAMKCAHRIYSLKDCLSASRAMYIFGRHSWFHAQENLEKAVVRVQSFVDRERLFGRSLKSSAGQQLSSEQQRPWNRHAWQIWSHAGMEVSDYSAVEVMSEERKPSQLPNSPLRPSVEPAVGLRAVLQAVEQCH